MTASTSAYKSVGGAPARRKRVNFPFSRRALAAGCNPLATAWHSRAAPPRSSLHSTTSFQGRTVVGIGLARLGLLLNAGPAFPAARAVSARGNAAMHCRYGMGFHTVSKKCETGDFVGCIGTVRVLFMG